MRLGMGLLVVLAAAACSKAPASIGTLSSSNTNASADYVTWTCDELSSERLRMSIAASVADPDTSSTREPATSEAGEGEDARLAKAIKAKGCSPAQKVASTDEQPSVPKPRKAQRP
jgi:hypothetical protein